MIGADVVLLRVKVSVVVFVTCPSTNTFIGSVEAVADEAVKNKTALERSAIAGFNVAVPVSDAAAIATVPVLT
jgi:hypothetical protein